MTDATRKTGWDDSVPFDAQEHLNEIGRRLSVRVTAISHLVDAARNTIEMADTRKPSPLDEQLGDSELSAYGALEAVLALAETIRIDAETLHNFELPKQLGERRAS
jgi:hypothetical protein